MKAKKTKVNREFKDGMFRTLFNDREKMLELYNAVSDEPLGRDAIEDIETLTLETPLYIGSRNDLAFSINGKSSRRVPTLKRCTPDRGLTNSSYFAGSSLPIFLRAPVNKIRKHNFENGIIFR